MTLQEACEQIEPLCEPAMEEAAKRWTTIAIPLHSLGKLEKAIIQIAGITGSAKIALDQKGIVAMCADNGVVAEGVTQSGQDVTCTVTNNFTRGETTACIMCKKCGATLFPVDIGVAVDTLAINRKICYGTKNMAKEPAMTRKQAEEAIFVGIDFVRELKEKGYQILGTGEMGIGNTTTSSAVASVLLDQPVERMTGRGAGLTSDGLARKKQVIQEAIALHKPDPNDPIDVLAKVGGLDIAGIAGVFLGGAIYHIPIVIDGFISAVGALIAARICPKAVPYMVASHVSKEPAASLVLDELGVSAMLHCEMRLGEGTGAVAVFPILDLALEVYHSMSSFEEANIEQYQELV